MQTYRYQALTKEGTRVNGVLDATDEYQAVARIKATYPIVIKIEMVPEEGPLDFLNKDLGKKVDTKALSVMCSQFAIMLKSGMNIAVCMEMIANQTEDKKLKEMLSKSAKDVAQGAGVATSFEKNCEGLPVTFIETVRAGEISGTLEHSFETLKGYYERSYQLSQKVRSALTYPIFVVIVAVVVLIIVMVRVMPTMVSVFDSLGGELPAMTQALIAVTNFFQRWWMLIVGIIAAVIVINMLWQRSETGRVKHAQHMLKMPVLGKINTLNGSAQFATTMSALLRAGLSVGNALSVTAKVMDNYALGLEIQKIVEKVEAGYRVGDCMRRSEYFPQILTEMTAIGEETGELEGTLDVIGDYYTNEADYAIRQAIAKLEPTMLVILAVFAGFIVISIYLPMFTMYDLM